MNCNEYKDKLFAYVEGLLDDSDKEAMAAHLKECSACRDEVSRTEQLQERLVADGVAYAESDLESDVFDRIVREQTFNLRKTERANYIIDVWRIIMNTKVTKFAAVAVIIIGVVLGVQMFKETGKLSWATVAEQLNDYTKCKWRQRVVREKGPDLPVMDVYHLNLSQRRQEVEDGSVHVINMLGADAITVELYPDTKKATVTKLIGFGPRKYPHII